MALSVAEVNHNSFSVHVLTENPLELSKNYLEDCKHRKALCRIIRKHGESLRGDNSWIACTPKAKR